jgi:hypothetical protein
MHTYVLHLQIGEKLFGKFFCTEYWIRDSVSRLPKRQIFGPNFFSSVRIFFLRPFNTFRYLKVWNLHFLDFKASRKLSLRAQGAHHWNLSPTIFLNGEYIPWTLNGTFVYYKNIKLFQHLFFLTTYNSRQI